MLTWRDGTGEEEEEEEEEAEEEEEEAEEEEACVGSNCWARGYPPAAAFPKFQTISRKADLMTPSQDQPSRKTLGWSDETPY